MSRGLGRLRRLAPELDLVRSSAIVLTGFSIARLLGFLFSVAAARLLAPSDFGRLTYALALSTIASVLLSSSPVGLSRFLARHADDRGEQQSYLSNWLTVVGVLLAISLVAAIVISILGGLDAWMTAGVAANVVGITVLETYREVQRGLGRFGAMTWFYCLANLLQLLAIFSAAAIGWRSPSLFVMIYGCSSLAAWLVVEWIAPVSIGFGLSTLDRRRFLAVLRFTRPLLIQSVFFAIWFSADLLFVQRTMGTTATGNYGAAKTLANALWLGPTAIGMALVPRVARLPENELRRYLLGVLALAAVVTAPPVAAMWMFSRPLVLVAFGDHYPDAAGPLGILAVGMGLHGLYIILFNLWVGLGRPFINMVSAAAGMVCTVVAALLLVPPFGLLGAATSFSLGSAARVVTIAVFTVWALRSSATAGSSPALRGSAVPGRQTSPMVPVDSTTETVA